jgi:hypothetical protein
MNSRLGTWKLRLLKGKMDDQLMIALYFLRIYKHISCAKMIPCCMSSSDNSI